MPNVLLLGCDKALVDKLRANSTWRVAVAEHSNYVSTNAPDPLHWNLILDDCCSDDTNDCLGREEAKQLGIDYYAVTWGYLDEAERAHAITFTRVGQSRTHARAHAQDWMGCPLAEHLRFQVDSPRGYRTLEFNPADDRASHLADFVENFDGAFRASRLSGVTDNSWTYESPTRRVLFKDVYSDPVAGLERASNLDWLLLPYMGEKDARVDAFLYLCYRTAPKLWPDVYSDLFHPKKVQALEEKLSRSVAERRALQHEIEAEIDEERRFYAPYVNLTVVGDDVLKDLVRKVFEEVFGCKVNDLDEEVEAHEDKTLDLFVTCRDWSAMLEVRSSGNRNARIDDLERLDDSYKLAAERYGEAKSKILVFNGMYSRDPAKRKQNPTFGTGIIREAKVRKIGLVSTQQLLEAIEACRNEDMAQHQFIKALAQPGLFHEPWR